MPGRAVRVKASVWAGLLFAASGALLGTKCLVSFAARGSTLSNAAGLGLHQQAARLVATSRLNGPTSVDLGTISAGGEAKARLRLTNSSDSWIEIADVQTSCDCLSVELAERRIPPHHGVEANARLDLSGEPEFTGGLCPEIRLFDAAGREAFCYTVNANVVTKVARCRRAGSDSSETNRQELAGVH